MQVWGNVVSLARADSVRDVDQVVGADDGASSGSSSFDHHPLTRKGVSGITIVVVEVDENGSTPSAGRRQVNELVDSGVLELRDCSMFDEEVWGMLYQDEGGEEELEIELHEEEHPFLCCQNRFSVNVTSVNIVRNPDVSVQRGAMTQADALAKERGELLEQQQRIVFDSNPKYLHRAWDDPMPEMGERHPALERWGDGFSSYDMLEWKKKQVQADQKSTSFSQSEGDHRTPLEVNEAWNVKNFSGPCCFESFMQAPSLLRAENVRNPTLPVMDRGRERGEIMEQSLSLLDGESERKEGSEEDEPHSGRDGDRKAREDGPGESRGGGGSKHKRKDREQGDEEDRRRGNGKYREGEKNRSSSRDRQEDDNFRRSKSKIFTEALLLLLLLLVVVPTHGGDINTDTIALLTFKVAVDPNNALSDWGTGLTTCQWTGISCANNRVWKVRLYNRGLVGSIPSGTLGALDQLRAINLHTNSLSGSLPADISDLSLVQNLYFHNNNLSGSLLSNFTVLHRILTLDLANNQFSGSIPRSFADLKLVTSIYLDGNQLSGSVPDIPTSSLVNFNVANNNLSGRIPASMERFESPSYAGNPGLCGSPTNVSCPPPSPPPSPTSSSPVPVPSSAASGPPSGRKKKKSRLSTGVIIAIVLGDVALLCLLALCCIFCFRRHKRQTPSASKDVVAGAGKAEDTKDEHASSTAPEAERSKLIFLEGKNFTFDLEDLLKASAEVLGKGSVGTAYKAVLEDGTVVTVKRLKDVTTTKKDFETQIATIGRFQHRNLVPLRAYYFSKDEKLLVYDYMPAGSLSALLHGTKGASRTPLDWISRVRIAVGAARGLAFLHNDHGFTHGNIKSSNVLLTRELEGCISDFGLVQLLSSNAAASRIIGYRAPEVLETRKVTFKVDVYSFGVLLLELLTGKAPTQSTLNDEGMDLPRWVQSVVREEWTAEVFDVELLRFQNIEEEMVQMLQIAMQCVLPLPDHRPTMDQVVKMLEDIRQFSDSGNENGDDSRSAYDTSAEKSKDELDVPSPAEDPSASEEFSISESFTPSRVRQ